MQVFHSLIIRVGSFKKEPLVKSRVLMLLELQHQRKYGKINKIMQQQQQQHTWQRRCISIIYRIESNRNRQPLNGVATDISHKHSNSCTARYAHGGPNMMMMRAIQVH